MIRNVIFDWSGTLVDDLPAVLDATNHVFEQAGLEPLTRERFCREFELPFTRFYERFLPHVPKKQLETWFHARFAEVHAQLVTPLPWAREFLEFCEASGMRTFVLSSVRADHYEQQARAAGFDRYLQVPYLGVWDKRDRIHELIRTHGLNPTETVFIGDMCHDIDTAKHGGVKSCAVLTGYNSLEQLRGSCPDFIVEHLGEYRSMLERERESVQTVAVSGGGRFPLVTVGALILDDCDRVLMVRTRKWSDKWGIPGGKIEMWERSEDALRREILEETALEVEEIEFVMVQDCIHSKEFYRDAHFVLLNYVCRAVRRVGANTSREELPVKLNDEAQAYRWLTMEEARMLDLNVATRVLLETVLAR
jgi:phosphoglycolate phosphatase